MMRHVSIIQQHTLLIGHRLLCIVTYTTAGILVVITVRHAIIFQTMDIVVVMVATVDITKRLSLIFQ